MGTESQDSWTLPVSEVNNNINIFQFLAQTDCFVSLDINVSSRAARFNLNLCVHGFFTLKYSVSSDCHYMTDCNG